MVVMDSGLTPSACPGMTLPPDISQARLVRQRAALAAVRLLQRAVRAHPIDGPGQVLREHREQLVDRQTGGLSHLLQLLVAERGAQLVRRDRAVLAIAEPGGDFAPMASLLQ